VRASARMMAAIITLTLFPTSAKSSPGHAPVNAQPSPKIVPPTAYRTPFPAFLGGIVIGSPEMVFNRKRLINATKAAATITGDAMISYIRGD